MYTVVRLFGVVRFCIFLIKYIWEDIAKSRHFYGPIESMFWTPLLKHYQAVGLLSKAQT